MADESQCKKGKGGKEWKRLAKQERRVWRASFKDQWAAMKEQKATLKETLRVMKESATTEAELRAFKELKKDMKAEFKGAFKEYKDLKKDARKSMDADRFSARHVEDVTIPDNSQLPANSPVIKTWRIRNNGAIAWPEKTRLIFVGHRGDYLNGPESVDVQGPVLPQQEVEVSVPFTTPSQPGRYVGYYRLATPEGQKFGQRVWVSFVVPHAPSAYTVTTTTSAMGDLGLD